MRGNSDLAVPGPAVTGMGNRHDEICNLKSVQGELVVPDLGWVDLNFHVPQSCLVTKPH